MEKKKLVIFSFNVSNVIDIITNSSSELFVLKGDTKDIVHEMIGAFYPNYKEEYAEIKSSKDLSNDEIKTYLSYAFHSWNWNATVEEKYPPLFGIPQGELYNDWHKRNEEKYFYPTLSETGLEKVKKAMDPNNDMWFLFSIDENPNWDMQERLSGIGQRYHLG